jgi:hypothetical protein
VKEGGGVNIDFDIDINTATFFYAGILFSLFEPEDGVDIFPRNVG